MVHIVLVGRHAQDVCFGRATCSAEYHNSCHHKVKAGLISLINFARLYFLTNSFAVLVGVIYKSLKTALPQRVRRLFTQSVGVRCRKFMNLLWFTPNITFFCFYEVNLIYLLIIVIYKRAMTSQNRIWHKSLSYRQLLWLNLYAGSNNLLFKHAS